MKTGNIIGLETLFYKQIKFQERIVGTDAELPKDNQQLFMYQIAALQEEVGELLKADKRWKTHRNTTFDVNEKLKELADCYITLINISIYSGFNVGNVIAAIDSKIDENNLRLDKEEDL